MTHDAAGTVKVRAAGRISKISKASRVQVDSVALGTATTAVTKNSVPHGSGAANSVISYTAVARKIRASVRGFRLLR